MAGEQREQSAIGRLGERAHDVDAGAVVTLRIDVRHRYVGGNDEQRLLREIERRCEHRGLGFHLCFR
jgi:uncharacterized protein YbjQ (UPF0145 family)